MTEVITKIFAGTGVRDGGKIKIVFIVIFFGDSLRLRMFECG